MRRRGRQRAQATVLVSASVGLLGTRQCQVMSGRHCASVFCRNLLAWPRPETKPALRSGPFWLQNLPLPLPLRRWLFHPSYCWPTPSCDGKKPVLFAMSGVAGSTERGIAAPVVLSTQCHSPSSSLKDSPDGAGSDGYFDATPHHVNAAVSRKPSFPERLVLPSNGGEGDDDHLADACLVM